MNEPVEIIKETNRKRKILPPIDHLRECISYDPETGGLTWKHRGKEHFSTLNSWSVWNSRFSLKEAGSKKFYPDGRPKTAYVNFHAGDKVSLFTCHSLIFHLMGVAVPDDKIIDHINTNPHDNRWCNLRLVNDVQSSCNRKKRNGGVNNLPKGVFPRNSKFEARIQLGGKRTYLGVFHTIEEAHNAYCDAAKRMHGEFARFE